jgi:hypothetical protein
VQKSKNLRNVQKRLQYKARVQVSTNLDGDSGDQYVPRFERDRAEAAQSGFTVI